MIKNKAALISSGIILSICMFLFFPFPDDELINARTTFMSFPIRTIEGYNLLGIIGSMMFLTAIILLALGLRKYRFRTVIIVFIVYAFLPKLLITVYQETFAEGIAAVSYDNNGTCDFEQESEDFITGECSVVLKNHSNEAVTFQLTFIDEFFSKANEVRMQSLLNENGPYNITLEANQ
jgi:hypothetical protein